MPCPHVRRRGSYDRSQSTKPISHAEQAWKHKQLVDTFSIGRPCSESCRYDRKCGLNVTPAALVSAHEYSYGRTTTREEHPDRTACTFTVERNKSQTMQRWRNLAWAAMSTSNEGEKKKVERLTVCKIGPVCQDFWAAAYGIPKGTANAMLAEARSGRLDADIDEAETRQALKVAMRSKPTDDLAGQMTIQWWETWLGLEDQMPNEAAIQHRTVVWQSVYELEYIPDIQWWGICRALSRSRWTQLRGVALCNMSIAFFGHKEGSPDVPLTMLSLVERPKHSNFGQCVKCSAAKDKWAHYRRCALRQHDHSVLHVHERLGIDDACVL